MLRIVSALCLALPLGSMKGCGSTGAGEEGPNPTPVAETRPARAEDRATPSADNSQAEHQNQEQLMEKVVKSESEWRAELDPEAYHVLRKKGTEAPFTNKFDHHFEPGVYSCAACGAELFESDAKFNSGCGWPAFYAAKAGDRVMRTTDYTHGMVRTEVTCARCDSHLGHVFDEVNGTPTNQRFCINSVSLKFTPKEE